jgi:acyl dehydratase
MTATSERKSTAAFSIRAFNDAKDSANLIHSDAEAKRYGFDGGLVPGVADYAYMSRPVLDRWGGRWLESGWMKVRLLRPVYDGDTVEVMAEPTDKEKAVMDLELFGGQGEHCATGSAGLRAIGKPPVGARFPLRPLPAGEERPEASLEVLIKGAYMGSLTIEVDSSSLRRDWTTRWGDAGALAEELSLHPAFYPDQGNRILDRNVLLGPWIHTESTVRHYGLPTVGETLTVRGFVEDSYERKGHQFVVLEVAFFGRSERPLAHLTHTAIFKPRAKSQGK